VVGSAKTTKLKPSSKRPPSATVTSVAASSVYTAAVVPHRKQSAATKFPAIAKR
jgi:hypothetical protein